MGNSLNCVSGNRECSKKTDTNSGTLDRNSKVSLRKHADGNAFTRPSIPDLLHHNTNTENQDSTDGIPELTNSHRGVNNNEKAEVFTFEKAFRLSQLSSSPVSTIPIRPVGTGTNAGVARKGGGSKRNKSDNCYVNIKPFVHPLPPVPSEATVDSNGDKPVGVVEPIPQEEYTPPTSRRAPPKLPADEMESTAPSPKLPPRPTNLQLSTAAVTTALQTRASHGGESSSDESAKTPLPRKVGFNELSLSFADSVTPQTVTSLESSELDASMSDQGEVSTCAVKRRPKKPPRNYSYKASTLPKRISHTTEEVMELWDEVRKAISLEKLNETSSLHISEEEEDDDIDEIYQNLYAARMRSWQIVCLSQDILVERLKPERVWRCLLSESLISQSELDTLRVNSCTPKESNQLIIDQILEHGDGWFDRLRELLRNHEDQKQISNLLEALNDVFIIGAKANKWMFSLTTKHCTVQQVRCRSRISDKPDLIGDTADGQLATVILELYDENFGNSSCSALADVLRKYNVISQLNVGKNRISSKGISKLVSGIEGNRCLEKLNLRLNPLENSGLELLGKALERNGSLKEVILCHTQLQDGAGRVISSIIVNNSSLELLDLSYNDLTDSDCKSISEALNSNSALRTLNLRGNQFGPTSWEHLSRALITNTTLQTLDVSHNQLTDSGVSRMCQALKTSNSLKELHVESCGIRTRGCVEIAEALTYNQGLAALYISNNSICDDGCEALADMLMLNSTLQTLYMNLCSINRKGLHRLLVVISHDNYSLRTLGACYNNVLMNDDDVVQDGFEAVDMRNALNRALESNTDRKILTWGKVMS